MKRIRINFNFFGNRGIFQYNDSVASKGIIKKFKEANWNDVVVLLVSKADISIRFRIVILYSIFLYLFNQLRIVEYTWLRIDIVCKIPPFAHPFYWNDKISMSANHFGVISKTDFLIILAALMVLLHIIFMKFFLIKLTSLYWLPLGYVFRWHE